MNGFRTDLGFIDIESNPDKITVISEDRQMSYRMLWTAEAKGKLYLLYHYILWQQYSDWLHTFAALGKYIIAIMWNNCVCFHLIVECVDEFEPYPKKHVHGGKPRPAISTLDECKEACLENDACTAVDWE